MIDRDDVLAKIYAACWRDPAFKSRFLSDPKAVLGEHGVEVPDRIDVKVVENADDCVHITLPKAPVDHGNLSDEELEAAAGGSMTSQARQYQRRQADPGSGQW